MDLPPRPLRRSRPSPVPARLTGFGRRLSSLLREKNEHADGSPSGAAAFRSGLALPPSLKRIRAALATRPWQYGDVKCRNRHGDSPPPSLHTSCGPSGNGSKKPDFSFDPAEYDALFDKELEKVVQQVKELAREFAASLGDSELLRRIEKAMAGEEETIEKRRTATAARQLAAGA